MGLEVSKVAKGVLILLILRYPSISDTIFHSGGENMGRWLDDPGEIPKREVTKVTEPRRQGFHSVAQIDLAEGWRQIVASQWRGVGLLDVLDGQRHIWGKQIIIAESAANREKLQANYPGVMIFTPQEFIDAVEHWPDNAATIQAKRTFAGDIQGVA